MRAWIRFITAGKAAAPEGGLVAPMPGKVVAWLAKPGTTVEKGAPLLILEAMKMEHTIAAPTAGKLNAFRFAVGEQVSEGAELVEFEKTEVHIMRLPGKVKIVEIGSARRPPEREEHSPDGGEDRADRSS